MQFSTLLLKSSFQNSRLIFKSHPSRFGLESLVSPCPVTWYRELQAPRLSPLVRLPAAQLGHPGVPSPIALAKQALSSAAREQPLSQEEGTGLSPGLDAPQQGFCSVSWGPDGPLASLVGDLQPLCFASEALSPL